MFVPHARRLMRLAALLGLVALVAGLEPAGARAEKYALLVGVRQYTGKGLKPLSWTEADMVDLAQALQTCGFRRENVVLMTDRVGARRGERYRPLVANIRRELRQLLRGRTAADTVLVAFSGHGMQPTANNAFYFCPVDTDPYDRHTMVSLGNVYQELARCPAGLKLLLADACRNDPFKASTSRALSDGGGVPRPQAEPVPGGVAAFFACSKGQEAYEFNALRNGVFFHFVIQGLRGAARAPGTQEVTLTGLGKYVTRQVTDYVRREERKEQVPELIDRTHGLVSLVGGPEDERRTSPLAQRTDVQTASLRRPPAGEAPAVADARQPRLEDLLARGQALARRGEPDKALALFDQALKLDPTSAAAHACRADALNDQGRFDQALAECDQALRLDPRLAAAHEFRADAYLGKRDFDKAARACAQALEIDPRQAGAYNDRGVLYTLQGKAARAVAEFTKALELDPKNGRAFGNRASTYFELGDYAHAVADYTEALRLGPRDPSAYYYRGVAHEKLGHAELARSDRTLARQLGFTPPKQ